jgi:hypothetical protein
MKTALVIALLTLPALAPAQTARELPLPASGSVSVPLDEYNRMMEMAAKPPKPVDGPPVPYLLKRAALSFEVETGAVTGAIQFDGDVLAAGNYEVPLVNGMTILDGKLGANPLPLEHLGPVCHAVLSGPGEFSLSLRTALALVTEAGRAGFRFPAPNAGAVQLTAVIPGDRTNVTITSGLIVSRRSGGGKTTVEATLEPGKPVEVWWATRESAPPPAPREVRLLSDVKTLVSVTESALRLTSLVEVTVVQGEPAQFQIELPAGYEVTTATGATLDSSSTSAGVLTLKLAGAPQRMHQFLISLERAADASTSANVPLPTVRSTQRETGEVLVESAGALEMAAKEGGPLKRMDMKETSTYLRQLAKDSTHAAFRYHRQPSEAPLVALEWVRFPASALPAAIAERATVTTLVTSEGKSLTEVKLLLSNQAQPFLKITLPQGATVVSAEVAGQPVKPVAGPDGQRVPLLRQGFRPSGLYTVSFVFLHSGAPFAKKGGSDLALPKLDLPVGVLDWEVFLPERYKVTDFGGNVTPAAFMAGDIEMPESTPTVLTQVTGLYLQPYELGGIVVDPQGAPIRGARVTIGSRTATTDSSGQWRISGIPSGQVRVSATAPGFNMSVYELAYDANRPAPLKLTLNVGSVSETVTVTAESPTVSTMNAEVSRSSEGSRLPKDGAAKQSAASANVLDLQRRVSGVLPVSIDVPKTGASYRFLKPLVVDEEATVSFTYKTR